MMKSVSAKMGVKPTSRAILINAPTEAVQALELPALDLETNLQGVFDYIHLFAITQAELKEQLPTLKGSLEQTGTLWVSWPKGGQRGTDLTLPKVIEIGYAHGLVESKSLSVNSTWSALKFTHPREGKSYNNSYGNLKL
ncbi:DUF3052 family protein [Fibrella forsythiae]|uniref:DUF3052 family protein n=1 Tax=Fibrella forsythiae TaxID=2817061 RepID=A0ABS3JUW0_9BACT|nr:DUF3052 family protein [Fibrella forsythiae]MBO0953161.1 DUF3052 family protein [Fibrella forsythiae]